MSWPRITESVALAYHRDSNVGWFSFSRGVATASALFSEVAAARNNAAIVADKYEASFSHFPAA